MPYTPSDKVVNGAAIVQGRLEALDVRESIPGSNFVEVQSGILPVNVKDPWVINNPYEPKTATADYDAEHNTWIPRDPSLIYILKNQTILTKGISGGYGGPIGGTAFDPSAIILIPGKY